MVARSEAVLDYHGATNHTNPLIWREFSRYFKHYDTENVIALPETWDETRDELAPPDSLNLTKLSYFLKFSSGITKVLYRQDNSEIYFRAAACTGALYHIELYVVCGDMEGLGAGIYHYAVDHHALEQLQRGDFRQVVVDACGSHPDLARSQAIVIYTDMFWRNAIKYGDRAYRHAFWDGGTILANSLALAQEMNENAGLHVGFVDATVNDLLNLNTAEEGIIAVIGMGTTDDALPNPPALQPVPDVIDTFEFEDRVYPAIVSIHHATSLAGREDVIDWQQVTLPESSVDQAGELIAVDDYDDADFRDIPLDEIIKRRGSTREFTLDSITFSQLSNLLYYISRDINADYRQSVNDIYLIINHIDELVPGSYFHHRDTHELELLEAGDFREAGQELGLYQQLAHDASVNIFMLADLDLILDHYGNRGYRMAQLDAGIRLGRVYLSAYAQGFGATGLTFYDRAVAEFFAPHASGKQTMTMACVGNKARGVYNARRR
ncbi:MAG: SagB/ThcOx family dehydrogenase [Chloroflexi bacterium]|nr:SagB/ThcOx family dehydrogenase [Chloroflexota bacterium]